MDTKLGKAMNAISDAQQYLSSILSYERLECAYIDRVLAKIVDPPTDGKQKNTRRSLQMIRDWMMTDGPGVVLLEVLGQLYWRLGDLNGKDFEFLKKSLNKQQSYLALVQDPKSTALVMQRVKYVQNTKLNAFHLFIQELDSSPASSPSSRSTTPPPLRSTTRESSISDASLDICDQPMVFGARNDEIESTLVCSDVPSCPKLGITGNWNLAMNDLEHSLLDFYINWLCPRRTLITKSNTYINLIAIAEHSPSTLFAILSLSASYLKDCLVSDSQRYEEADHFYALKAVRALGTDLGNQDVSRESCLATGMLLVHHDIVNETPETEVCWTCHINMLDVFPLERDVAVDSDPARFMRYQLILARTAQSVDSMQTTGLKPSSTNSNARSANGGRLDQLDDDDPESQRICGVLGLSQQLLSLIESITTLVADGPLTRRDYKMSYAALLQHRLAELRQWTTMTTTEVCGKALEVVNRTAETYCVAAQIYLQCRFFGLTKSHPTIIKLNAKICTLILSLPDTGPLYTALYPIWPFFIAAVTCNNNGNMRDTLYGRVWNISIREKSNLGSVLQHLSGVGGWIEREGDIEQRRQGWWEEMLASAKPRATLLSLG